MAAKVTRKDVSEYRALAKKEGRGAIPLTDDQVVAQIRILRGAMASPTPSDLEDILARAKATEKIFQQCKRDVLRDLQKGLGELQQLDRAPSGQPKSRPSSLLAKRAHRVLALKRQLLVYPPSMLTPELQKILELVGSWAIHAENALNGGHPEADRVLLGITGQLAKAMGEVT